MNLKNELYNLTLCYNFAGKNESQESSSESQNEPADPHVDGEGDDEIEESQRYVARDGTSWIEIESCILILSSSSENIVHVSPSLTVASKRKLKSKTKRKVKHSNE